MQAGASTAPTPPTPVQAAPPPPELPWYRTPAARTAAYTLAAVLLAMYAWRYVDMAGEIKARARAAHDSVCSRVPGMGHDAARAQLLDTCADLRREMAPNTVMLAIKLLCEETLALLVGGLVDTVLWFKELLGILLLGGLAWYFFMYKLGFSDLLGLAGIQFRLRDAAPAQLAAPAPAVPFESMMRAYAAGAQAAAMQYAPPRLTHEVD
jgi:hypothetical protein